MAKTTVEYVLEVKDVLDDHVHYDTSYYFNNVEDAIKTAKSWKEKKFKVAVYEITNTKLRLRIK